MAQSIAWTFPLKKQSLNFRPPMSRPAKNPMLLSEGLPYDIIFDILTRLPVKSLIRFCRVSKSWYSTITSPIFITKHLDRANSLSNTNNNNNGYLLFTAKKYRDRSCEEWTKFVYNTDRTLTQISKVEIPYTDDLRHIFYVWKTKN